MPPATGASRGGRLAGPVAVVLVFAGLFAVGLSLGRLSDPLTLPGWAFSWFTDGGDPPPGEFPVLAPSEPLRLEIPRLRVSAPVHGVGLDANGAVAAPPLERVNEAGWYEDGPTPGQFGPAVIVGHVDSTDGPAVFHKVDTLREGDRIEVTRRDRQVAVFRVDRVERHGKEQLPAERVYGDFSRPQLRLITCGGRWIGGSIGYEDNVIVFATLVEAHRA